MQYQSRKGTIIVGVVALAIMGLGVLALTSRKSAPQPAHEGPTNLAAVGPGGSFDATFTPDSLGSLVAGTDLLVRGTVLTTKEHPEMEDGEILFMARLSSVRVDEVLTEEVKDAPVVGNEIVVYKDDGWAAGPLLPGDAGYFFLEDDDGNGRYSLVAIQGLILERSAQMDVSFEPGIDGDDWATIDSMSSGTFSTRLRDVLVAQKEARRP